ncbi:MAG TPA: efflux RND transporter periplasmic adaptor subunit [Noviherbaspirillum sp.]|jgi:RND family efflux transporter MFP subunit|uniref:efflux RND transporter periplasmic adaptor subunit n=1 Tax=Noviherbaspirillum sp. TaxID=1926288 RepID=UPI002F92A871
MNKNRLYSALALLCAVPALHAQPQDGPPAAPSLSAPAASSAAALPQEAAKELSALISADSEATLSAQMPGKIRRVHYAIGQNFGAGATLVEFDCAEAQARLEAQQAEYLGARETHLAKLKLQGLGAAGELEVTLAAAATEKAKSMIRQQEAQIAYCRIKAPYAGRVVRLKAREAENVNINQPVMEIVAQAKRKAVVHVPSSWSARLKPGQPFKIRVNDTGKEYPVKLARLNGRVDGVSQSLEIEAQFTGKTDDLLPGMIGQAVFPDSVTKGN